MKLFDRAFLAADRIKWRLSGGPSSYDELFEWEKKNNFRFTRRLARRKHGYDLNLNTPRSFNEKLIHRRLFSRDPIWPIVTDKIGVREWVEQRGFISSVRLPEIIDVFDSPENIPQSLYGQPVVVKAAWASGLNVFLDNERRGPAEIWNEFAQWYVEPYAIMRMIWASHQIPRRFLVEKKFLTSDGKPPPDYKFFVFHGKVAFCQVDFDRFNGHRRNLFDREGVRMNFAYKVITCEADIGVDRHTYRKMVDISEKVGEGFDFIRIDLYNIGQEIFLGEITQTPEAGFGKITPAVKDFELGDMWNYMPGQRSYLGV